MRTNSLIVGMRVLLAGGAFALAGCGADAPPTPALPAPPSATTALTTAAPSGPAATVIPSTATLAAPEPTSAPTGTVASAAVTVPAPATTAPSVAATPPPAAALPTEVALTPEQSAAGDIPDSQAFVAYQSPDGSYQVDVPEGWARTEDKGTTRFESKLDGVAVTLSTAAAAPSTASVRSTQVPALQAAERAVQVSDVSAANLPGGAAIVITYSSNSDPNAVTGKQVRLENAEYLFFRGGHLVTLHLWAPAGADNVDQWKRMSESFRWR